MNYKNWIEELQLPTSSLEGKAQQTDYKIQYILAYVKHWLLVTANRHDVSNINFIDCMCNAGIYLDGDLGTAMRVLILFKDFSINYPNKNFSLYLNDYDPKRMAIIKSISDKILGPEYPKNIFVYYYTSDVNEYLRKIQYNTPCQALNSTILFVDPYDLGTVNIQLLSNFARRFYAEIIFNLFVNDFVRNHRIDPGRIATCLGEGLAIDDSDKLIELIRKKLHVGHIKHVFFYQFNNSKNAELYQIVFATPSRKGLEKLKEAIWEVFNGRAYHRNLVVDVNQITLFDSAQEKQSLLSDYATRAKSLLLKNFAGRTVNYTDIDIFLLENTMMRKTDIIRNVLLPLIEEKRIKKLGLVDNKTNYTHDQYFFLEETQP